VANGREMNVKSFPYKQCLAGGRVIFVAGFAVAPRAGPPAPFRLPELKLQCRPASRVNCRVRDAVLG